MTRRTTHRRGGSGRKTIMYRVTNAFAGAASGTTEVFDVLGDFKTNFGAAPPGMTLGPIWFNIETVGTGTGTGGPNNVTLGWAVGPNTLDAADLVFGVTAAPLFWWTHKYFVDDGATPKGSLQRGYAQPQMVKTKRIVQNISDTLWLAVDPSFTGYTALGTTVAMIVACQLP